VKILLVRKRRIQESCKLNKTQQRTQNKAYLDTRTNPNNN